jgi:hypothetical protein
MLIGLRGGWCDAPRLPRCGSGDLLSLDELP